MKIELILNVLQIMNVQEYEDIWVVGSDECCELIYVVMWELDVLDNWMMNGEYGSEFGGFFFVQVCFMFVYECFYLVLCLLGDVFQVWVLVLVNVGGELFVVVQVQWWFVLEVVSYLLVLVVLLDMQGYSVNDIIYILMVEGGQV